MQTCKKKVVKSLKLAIPVLTELRSTIKRNNFAISDQKINKCRNKAKSYIKKLFLDSSLETRDHIQDCSS